MTPFPLSIHHRFETNCTIFNLWDPSISTTTLIYEQTYSLSIEDIEVGKWLIIALHSDRMTTGTLQPVVVTSPFQLTPAEVLSKPVNPYYELNQAVVFLYSPTYTPIQLEASVGHDPLKL